jgi:hypothetical protein
VLMIGWLWLRNLLHYMVNKIKNKEAFGFWVRGFWVCVFLACLEPLMYTAGVLGGALRFLINSYLSKKKKE